MKTIPITGVAMTYVFNCDIAIDDQKSLAYITTCGNCKVIVIDINTGAKVREWGSEGRGDGQFITAAYGICFLKNVHPVHGDIIVVG